jgi:O-antigen ligase
MAAAVALLLYSSWLPESAVERVEMTRSTDTWGEENLDPSVEQRHLVWEGGREMVLSNPLGVGLGRFGREIGNYGPIQGLDAHNQYLLIAAEAGIPGLASYLLLLLGLLSLAFRLVRRAHSEEEMVLGWGYSAALLGVVLGGLYGSPVFMGEVTGNFWALSGIAARHLQLEEEESSGEDGAD